MRRRIKTEWTEQGVGSPREKERSHKIETLDLGEKKRTADKKSMTIERRKP